MASFPEIWRRCPLGDLSSCDKALGLVEGYLGWRKRPWVSHPIMSHDEVTEAYIRRSPRAYGERLETPGSDPLSYRKVRPICKLSRDDPKLEEFFDARVPCVVRGDPIVRTGGDKWSLAHLRTAFGEAKVSVYSSGGVYFRYWKEALHTGPYRLVRPTQLRDIKFSDFLALATAAQRRGAPRSGKRGACVYLQETLSGHSSLAGEFASWNWRWLLDIVRRHGWGIPDTNVLLCGLAGSCTPNHYDEQENVFCQVRGLKEVYLWPPADGLGHYAFPVNHACDRQAMPNPDEPDLKRFPKFRFVRPHRVTLEPGDALYLPAAWWHHFRNLEDFSTSVTFWSKQKKATLANIRLPLDSRHHATVRRNLEDLTVKRFGEKSLVELASTARARWLQSPVFAFMVDCLSNFMPRADAPTYIEELLNGRYTDDTDQWVVPNIVL